jgi:outer membrane lipopolysaccharide assembly protein LptE/RlpB
MRLLLLIALALILTACGVDVATATATTAKLQAEQAKQAQETAARITQQLDANTKALAQRTADMADDKRQ